MKNHAQLHTAAQRIALILTRLELDPAEALRTAFAAVTTTTTIDLSQCLAQEIKHLAAHPINKGSTR